LLGEIKEPPRRFSMRLSHYTILQLSCCFVSYENWRHLRPRKLHSRQGYAFSALFPEIRELHTMTRLLDLERQGYGFRAAKHNLANLAKLCRRQIVKSAKLDCQVVAHSIGKLTFRLAGYTDISNNVCGVKAFFERRTARTPRSCFDSALVEELIIDDEGSHVICRAELGPTQTSLRSHVRP
jgi:hypothetical protein